MTRQVKCPYCEKKLNKEDAYEYKKRYYHPQCFDQWKRDSQDRKELIEYICKLYRLESPTGMILKQIKEYHEEYKYKYKGMELALRYFYETLGNSVQDGSGIGIVPFVYEDAKNYFILKLKVEDSVKNMKKEETQIVEVSSPKPFYKRKIKYIDISSL